MRTWWRSAWVLVIVALAAGCSGGRDQTPGGSQSSIATTTSPISVTIATTVIATTSTSTAPSTTSTSTSVSVSVEGLTARVPDHLRYGADGLLAVRNGAETKVMQTVVDWADSDGAGGIVYRIGDQLWWRATESSESVIVAFDGFPTLVDNRPALVGHGNEPCGDGDGSVWGVVHDLASGDERRLGCAGWAGDSWSHIADLEADRYLVEHGMDLANYTTMSDLSIFDLANTLLQLPGNPYSDYETCRVLGPGDPSAACEVHGRLSPDGRLLATWYRPDYAIVVAADGMPTEVVANEPAWLARLDTLPAEIRVLELDTGAERYQTRMPARTRLADFDGRFLVVAPCRTVDLGTPRCADPNGSWTIIDVTGQQPPITVSGPIALLRPLLVSGPVIHPEVPSLRQGDAGAWVSFLQRRLVADGADVAVDGVFGTGTETAVEEIQRMAGIAVDGIVGPATWSALTTATAGDWTVSRSVTPPVTPRPGGSPATGVRPRTSVETAALRGPGAPRRCPPGVVSHNRRPARHRPSLPNGDLHEPT